MSAAPTAPVEIRRPTPPKAPVFEPTHLQTASARRALQGEDGDDRAPIAYDRPLRRPGIAPSVPGPGVRQKVEQGPVVPHVEPAKVLRARQVGHRAIAPEPHVGPIGPRTAPTPSPRCRGR